MQPAATSAAETASGSVEGFTYGELALRVAASRPQPLRWLEEFLSPAFRIGARDVYSATVVLHEDSQRYDDALARRPTAASVELDSFVNDSHMIRLPAWASTPGSISAFQEDFRVLYVVDRETRSIAVLSPASNPHSRTALMRVVRELAMNRSWRDRGMFLHAAAIAVGERGMLIAGEKRAGKTSLLLHLLRATAAEYVSNDRVLLPSMDAATVRGMPTIVTVRPGTLAFLPGFAAEIVARSYHYRRTLAETADHPAPLRASQDGSYSLSAVQLCALLSVERRAECPPHVLLFPRITGAANAGRLRDLAPAEAAARLRRALLSADLSTKTSELLSFPDDPPPPDAPHLEEMCRGFVARVRCLECQLGTRAYESGALAAECLRVLTA
jgi:hypothetical protein